MAPVSTPPPAAPAPEGRRARPRTRPWSFALGFLVMVVAAVVVANAVDFEALRQSADAMADRPLVVVLSLAAFGTAFLLRAAAWCRVLPRLSFRQSLAGIHLAFGANHVLPLRLGEPLRIVSVVRRADVPLTEATSSTVALRAADILAIVLLGLLVGPRWWRAPGVGWAVLAAVLAVGGAGVWWLRRTACTARTRCASGPRSLLTSWPGWRRASHPAGLALGRARPDLRAAVVVTAVAVGADRAIAPSGLGPASRRGRLRRPRLSDAGAGPPPPSWSTLTTAYPVVGAVAFKPAPGISGDSAYPPLPGGPRPLAPAPRRDSLVIRP